MSNDRAQDAVAQCFAKLKKVTHADQGYITSAGELLHHLQARGFCVLSTRARDRMLDAAIKTWSIRDGKPLEEAQPVHREVQSRGAAEQAWLYPGQSTQGQKPPN